MTTEKGTGKGKAATADADIVERVPFLFLALDLPAAPLFKDVLEKNIIPQVGGEKGEGEGNMRGRGNRSKGGRGCALMSTIHPPRSRGALVPIFIIHEMIRLHVHVLRGPRCLSPPQVPIFTPFC